MKVSCQSCGAQYNLPDDKVRGRKAKVRCKKCSAQIIVDGTSFADEEDDEATRVMQAPSLSSSGEPVWTVNLSDEDQLDMTEPEILAGWRDGRVTEDAYVWREGMEEWLPIMESDLGASIRGLAAPAAPEPTPAPVVAAPAARDLKSAPNTRLGSSPQAAPAPKLGSSPLAASPAPPAVSSEQSSPQMSRGSVPSPKPKSTRSDDTSKAFSFALSGSSSAASSSNKKASRPPGAAAAVGGLFGSPAPAPAPAPAASQAAASSENSVMFSLDALKAAAAVEPKRSSVRAAAVTDGRVNEDILTLGGPSRFDDNAMPLIDIEVPPPAPRYDAPVAAAPLAAPAQKKSSWGMIAIALVAVAGMGGAYVLGQQGKDKTTVAQNDGSTVSGTRQGNDVGAEATATAAATDAPAATSAAPTAPAVASNTPTPSTSGGGGKGAGASGAGGSKTGGDKQPDKPVAESGGKTGGDKPAPAPAPAPAAGKPAGPAFNVAAAKAALNNAAAGAAGCRAPAGPNGTGKVQVTFAPSGNVTSALIVAGPFGGTPVGSCVARTFRAAKVPAFDGSPMTVSKSFTIN